MGTKEKIIEAADQLFYACSIRDVSVDRVAEEAGITKRTLYYHFRSKDDLVAAYLAARDEPTIARYREWAGTQGPMSERVGRMFEALAKAVEAAEWKGCGFVRAAVELADTPGHPALEVSRRHKAAFERWLRDDLREEGYEDAEGLARMLLILLDGAVTRMLVSKDPGYARDAGTAACSLLAAARQTIGMYTD